MTNCQHFSEGCLQICLRKRPPLLPLRTESHHCYRHRYRHRTHSPCADPRLAPGRAEPGDKHGCERDTSCFPAHLQRAAAWQPVPVVRHKPCRFHRKLHYRQNAVRHVRARPIYLPCPASPRPTLSRCAQATSSATWRAGPRTQGPVPTSIVIYIEHVPADHHQLPAPAQVTHQILTAHSWPGQPTPHNLKRNFFKKKNMQISQQIDFISQ